MRRGPGRRRGGPAESSSFFRAGGVFYASFIPGLEDVIAEIVKKELPGVKILRLLSGAVLFEAPAGGNEPGFLCFNNVFSVISVAEPGGQTPLEDHMRLESRRGGGFSAGQDGEKARSFRIVTSMENRPAAVDAGARREMERYIAGCSGLAVNRSGPDAEFWFLYRREGISLFMRRLTKRPSWEKSLRPGELPPPLAWTLCHLAGLGRDDLVLDPFCGNGSIPFQALRFFGVKKCLASDCSAEAIRRTKAKLAGIPSSRWEAARRDFFSLAGEFPGAGAGKIVSDPPWGLYAPPGGKGADFAGGGGAGDSLEAFYRRMFDRFGRLLPGGGTAALLCAPRGELAAALETAPLRVVRRISILLSGRKTCIFVLENLPRS